LELLEPLESELPELPLFFPELEPELPELLELEPPLPPLPLLLELELGSSQM
jgi:hypothetical protein